MTDTVSIENLLLDAQTKLSEIIEHFEQDEISVEEIGKLYSEKGLLFEQISIEFENIKEQNLEIEVLKKLIDVYQKVNKLDKRALELIEKQVEVTSADIRTLDKESKSSEAYETAGNKKDTSLFIRSKLEG